MLCGDSSNGGGRRCGPAGGKSQVGACCRSEAANGARVAQPWRFSAGPRGSCRRKMRAHRPCRRAMRARSKSGHAAVRKRRTEREWHSHGGSVQGARAIPEVRCGRAGHAGGRCRARGSDAGHAGHAGGRCGARGSDAGHAGHAGGQCGRAPSRGMLPFGNGERSAGGTATEAQCGDAQVMPEGDAGRAGHARGRCGRAPSRGMLPFGSGERSAGGTATEVQRRARVPCRRAMRGVSPALVNKFCVQNLLTSAPKSDAVKRGAMGLPGKKGRAASA